MKFYKEYSNREKLMCFILRDPVHYINKYLEFLRKEEYYYNVSNNSFHKLMYLYYLSKKNNLGNKLGFKIPKNTFGPGLTIYHHGEIIINENSKMGANCKLHGGNCIGNNGKNDNPPKIGDNLDLGIGAKIIGDVELGDNVVVGANAVVTKSFIEDNIVLVGIPAKKIGE